MAKKKAQRRQQATASPPQRAKRRKLAVIIGSFLILSLVGGMLAQWRAAGGASRSNTLLTPVPTPTPTPLSLSKEYIYAGGKLVATEEPSNTNPLLSAPTGFSATTVTNGTPVRIDLHWADSSGPVHHYEIKRIGGGPDVSMTVLAPATAFNDTSIITTNVSPYTAYLYQVRAVDAANHYSPYSNVDVATAIAFADDPLGDPQATPPTPRTIIRAEHRQQLRDAINAVRSLAGLGAYTWTPHPAQPNLIYAQDVLEMRVALDQALTVLKPPPLQTYTDPNLTTGYGVSRAHFQELRDRVK